MTLSPNTKIAQYEILGLVGAGGMGEVYRARDEKLGREVAIKVLPEAFSEDTERLARFEREARAVAALSHPNIVAIHDFAQEAGRVYAVMELLEGETLAERLGQGALSQRKAVEIGSQIARGLAAAHDKNVTHRDLKPANVFVTKDGRVKILDFGLARLRQPVGGASQDESAPTEAQPHTEEGIVMGTVGYMSPEQVRGEGADHRSDVFSFGAILYEMLTGSRAFQRDTTAETMTAILKEDPLERLESLPPALARIAGRCLEKRREERFQSAHDLAFALDSLSRDSGASPAVGAAKYSIGRPSWWVAAALALAAAAGGAVVASRPGRLETPSGDAELLRFAIPLPEGAELLGDISLSPDGRAVVFVARHATGGSAIWVRALDDLEPRRIDGTEGARLPFWSPDGRSLGFFQSGELRIADLLSLTPRTLAPTASPLDARGATWGAEDVIVYAPTFTGGLMQVPAGGGEPAPATRVDVSKNEGTHRLPRFLPDGRHFLFFISPGAGAESGWLGLGELGSTDHRRLTEASSSAVFVPPHALLYARGATLVAQRIDLDRLELSGDPVPLGVELPGSHVIVGLRALTAAGANVAYQVRAPGGTRLVWVDRQGREMASAFDAPGWLVSPRLSPDGERIAVVFYSGSENGELWVVDPGRNNRMRMTSGEREDMMAMWSRDGRELALYSLTDSSGIYLLETGRPSSARLWKAIDDLYSIDSWVPDGKTVLFTRMDAEGRRDIYILESDAGAEPRPLLATPADEHLADVSPDGSWVAYTSDASGRDEVYVRRMEGGDEAWRVSNAGGFAPRWSRDGRELYYVDLTNNVLAVPTTLGSSFAAGEPDVLFQTRIEETGYREYDVAPDGQRFLVNENATAATNPIVVVHGWAPVITKLLAEPRADGESR